MHRPDPDEANFEAAAWLSRLQSGERTRADEEQFARWLEKDVAHQKAFDNVTLSWELAGSLTDIPRERVSHVSRRAVLASAVIAGVGTSSGLFWVLSQRLGLFDHADNYSSNVGEIRRLTLADGSHLVLDTDSRADVVLTPSHRHVRLVKGRVHVEVAKDPSRPFTVMAADQRVVALGTAFDVELQPTGMRVSLTEGLVNVIAKGGTRASLTPGQRLSDLDGIVHIDEPDPRKTASWQSGRLVFDNDTLHDAVEEINRYDRRHIVFKDSAIGSYKISGSYETGNTHLFAASVSELLHLKVEESSDHIILSGAAKASA